MTDPAAIVTVTGWVATLAVLLVAKIRRSEPSDLNDIRDVIRAEIKPVYNIVDATEHEMAVLRKEIGEAISSAQTANTRVTELEDRLAGRIAEMGEAVERRAAALEERVRVVITDRDRPGE